MPGCRCRSLLLHWCDSALGRRSNGTLNRSTVATDLLSGLLHADPVAIMCPVPPPVEAGLGHEPGSPAKRWLTSEVPMTGCRIGTPRPRSVLGVVLPLRDRVFASFSWADRRDDRRNGVSVRSRFGEPGCVFDFDVDVNFDIFIDAWSYRRKARSSKVGIELDLETAVVLGGGSGANRHRNHETKSKNCRDKRYLHEPLCHFNHLLCLSSSRRPLNILSFHPVRGGSVW